MKPQFSKEEIMELERLLKIVEDKRTLPGRKRLAMAKFDKIYNEAAKRMNEANNRRYTVV